MKWFKHESNSSMDAKLQELLLDYGASGYGLYWYCLELIAEKVSSKNVTFELEHDARVIARNLNLTVQETQDMMQKMVDLGLFDINQNNRIMCISMVKILDDSLRKSKYSAEILSNFNESEKVGKIPNNSRKVPLEEEKNKNRVDEEVDEDIEF